MGEDILCLCDLFLRSGESDLHFPGSARDLNFDGVETIADHAGAELFVGFVGAVFLEAIAHGAGSVGTGGKAMLIAGYFPAAGRAKLIACYWPGVCYTGRLCHFKF